MPDQPSHNPAEHTTGEAPAPDALRADARRNRERVLEAARGSSPPGASTPR